MSVEEQALALAGQALALLSSREDNKETNNRKVIVINKSLKGLNSVYNALRGLNNVGCTEKLIRAIGKLKSLIDLDNSKNNEGKVMSTDSLIDRADKIADVAATLRAKGLSKQAADATKVANKLIEEALKNIPEDADTSCNIVSEPTPIRDYDTLLPISTTSVTEDNTDDVEDSDNGAVDVNKLPEYKPEVDSTIGDNVPVMRIGDMPSERLREMVNALIAAHRLSNVYDNVKKSGYDTVADRIKQIADKTAAAVDTTYIVKTIDSKFEELDNNDFEGALKHIEELTGAFYHVLNSASNKVEGFARGNLRKMFNAEDMKALESGTPEEKKEVVDTFLNIIKSRVKALDNQINASFKMFNDYKIKGA